MLGFVNESIEQGSTKGNASNRLDRRMWAECTMTSQIAQVGGPDLLASSSLRIRVAGHDGGMAAADHASTFMASL